MARHSGLRLCVSTTPDLEVSTIKMHDLKYLSVNMAQSGMAADIEAYIESSLGQHDVFRGLDAQLREHIKEGIMSRANGSFRWVDCHSLDRLRDKTLSPKWKKH